MKTNDIWSCKKLAKFVWTTFVLVSFIPLLIYVCLFFKFEELKKCHMKYVILFVMYSSLFWGSLELNTQNIRLIRFYLSKKSLKRFFLTFDYFPALKFWILYTKHEWKYYFFLYIFHYKYSVPYQFYNSETNSLTPSYFGCIMSKFKL